MKKSLTVLLLTAFAASMSLSGITQAQEKKITVRMASAFDQNTSMIRAAQKFAGLVSERSKKQIEIKLFPGGTMGGEKETLEALKLGELEMGVFGTFPIVQLSPKYSFFDAPFVFRDKDHFYKVWEGKLGDALRADFQKQDVHSLGVMGRGYRHLTSEKPINSVDDMKGLKIRMGQSKPFIDAFTEIGCVVSPIALPELFTSLKMGVVAASDGPFDQIYSFKLYEAQKHLTLTGHLYAVSMWLANDAFYQKLSAEQKAIIDQAAKEALAYGDRETANDEKKLLDELQNKGMKVAKVDIKPFMAKAKPALDKLFRDMWPVTTADEIAKY